jgi:hypothetical protein
VCNLKKREREREREREGERERDIFKKCAKRIIKYFGRNFIKWLYVLSHEVKMLTCPKMSDMPNESPI